MAIDINYKVQLDSGGLTQALESMRAQLEALADKLGTTGNSTQTVLNDNIDPGKQSADKTDKIPDVTKTTSQQQVTDSLVTNLQNLTEEIKRANLGVRQVNGPFSQKLINEQIREESRAQRLGQLDVRKNEEHEWETQRSFAKFARGMLLGSGVALSYQAGSWGATSGNAYNSLNTSAGNYMQFQNELYNQRVGNVTSGVGLGSMALPGLGALLGNMILPGIGGAIGTGAGMAGAGVLNYFTQKEGNKAKAENEFATQLDFVSWRMQQLGLSGRGNSSFAGGSLFGQGAGTVHLTQLQEALAKPSNAPFIKDAMAVIGAGRRDVMGGMSADNLANYSSLTQKNAMIMGVNPQSLSQIASNYSAFTGEPPTRVLQKLLDTNTKYGGDTVANTAKMLQIMTATPMSATNASNLVNRYQYNDAILQNRVNASLASPQNKFVGNVFGQMLGLSHSEMSEIHQGVMPKRLQNEYRRNQKSNDPNKLLDPRNIFMEQMASSFGINLQANDIGAVKPFDTKLAKDIKASAPDTPEVFKGFANNVIDALKNITTINAGNVTVIGQVTDTYDKINSKLEQRFTSNINSIKHGAQSSAEWLKHQMNKAEDEWMPRTKKDWDTLNQSTKSQRDQMYIRTGTGQSAGDKGKIQ